MAPSSTLHSSSWNNSERKRDCSRGNPHLEQTIFFPSKASYRRLRIFKLGNVSNVAIWSSSSLVLNKVNLARFWENWWVFGSFFFMESNIFSFSTCGHLDIRLISICITSWARLLVLTLRTQRRLSWAKIAK